MRSTRAPPRSTIPTAPPPRGGGGDGDQASSADAVSLAIPPAHRRCLHRCDDEYEHEVIAVVGEQEEALPLPPPSDGWPPDSWTCCQCWTDYGSYTDHCLNCGHRICNTCPQL